MRTIFAPTSPRIVTSASNEVSFESATVPDTLMYGRSRLRASSTVPHGIASVHAVPLPVIAAYATSDSAAHVPPARQTFESHSAFVVHAPQVWSALHTGFGFVHVAFVMHGTQTCW